MANRQPPIFGSIYAGTKEAIERYAETRGPEEVPLVEEDLLHHLQALRGLPLDVIIPARLVVSRESGQIVLDRVEKAQQPTEAMHALFRK